MSLKGALLLPTAALLVVAIALVGVLLLRDDGGSNTGARPAATADSDAPADDETPGTRPQPRLQPESNVCQGILHRPAAGEPRTFPAFYTQRTEESGIAIVGGPKVATRAFTVARETIRRMFAHNDLAAALASEGAYVVIADRSQGILDLPEFGCVTGGTANQLSHACGVADRADYPVVTVNELDLTGDRAGPCGGLNVLYHELGHLVQGWTLDPTDYFDVKLDYQAAKDAGKYRGQYAATNPFEYFAEATQSYFLSSTPGGRFNRAWLRDYDPEIYAMVKRVYNDGD